MTINPPPNPHDLLLPLLACLPTAAISSRPPPALLPLLAPILRQRISYLSESVGNKSWLSLLSWDAEKAAKLPQVVERMDLEPHPVSGEVELEDVRPAQYRRTDEETLHARLEVEQFDLLPIYVWCEKDEHGGTEPGWKLAELRTLEDMEDGSQWFASQSQANEAAPAPFVDDAVPAASAAQARAQSAQPEEDDNDDYWAAYDRTPGQTPANDGAPAKPNPHPTNGRQMADAQYFARYGAEVQPALDAHDPDEDHEGLRSSTLRGDSLVQPAERESSGPTHSVFDNRFSSVDTEHLRIPDPYDSISMPRPISPTSSHSSVEHLEEQAAAMSSSRADENQPRNSSIVDAMADRAQRGIKMHISTDIKSLFRLARSSGMERAEFEAVVRRELDMLSFMEADD